MAVQLFNQSTKDYQNYGLAHLLMQVENICLYGEKKSIKLIKERENRM